jgi:hypothetical protein
MKKNAMRYVKYLFAVFFCVFMLNAHAGLELVCKGAQPKSNGKVIYINCQNRKEFVDTIGSAWRELRKNSIGGHLEDMCWEAYKQAKDMHPSISFADISDSFLIRCNMGLEYVN